MDKYVFFIFLLFFSVHSFSEVEQKAGQSIIFDSEFRESKFAKSAVILSDISSKRNFCSGFIVDLDGKKYLMTNNHCIDSQNKCQNTRILHNYNRLHLRKYYSDNGLTTRLADIMMENGSYVSMFEGMAETPVYSCAKLIITNKTLDLSLAEISTRVNHVKVDENSFDSINLIEDVSHAQLSGNRSISVVGFPGVREMTLSNNCNAAWSSWRSGIFHITHDCNVEGGNSGSMVIDDNSQKIVGVISHIASMSDEMLEILGLSTSPFGNTSYFINMTTVFPKIVEFLRKDPSYQTGIWSSVTGDWTPLNSNLKFSIYNRDQTKDISMEPLLVRVNQLIENRFPEAVQGTIHIASDTSSLSYPEIIRASDSDDAIINKLISSQLYCRADGETISRLCE